MSPTVSPLPSAPSLVSRTMSLLRRWLSAAAGLALLAITLSGTLLPHQGEMMGSATPDAYAHGTGPDPVSLPQAIATIENAHPSETVLSATRVHNVIEVRTERSTYTVSPDTGAEIGRGDTAASWVAALENLHRCLLSCEGPGHVRWMSQEIPHTRWWDEHRGMTVGGLAIVTSGVVLLVLAVSALRVWWPLQRYRRTALSSRRRTQHLSRDTDLLKAAGLVVLPLLFLWGYYASAYGIHPTRPTVPTSTAAIVAPAGQARAVHVQDGQGRQSSQGSQGSPGTGPSRAVAVAQEARGGKPVALFLPEPNDPSSTYTVWLSQGATTSRQRSVSSVVVRVDPGPRRSPAPSSPAKEPTARAG